MGLFTGSAVGVLSLLAILNVQFKDWRFDDGRHWVRYPCWARLLLWMFFLAYLISWWLVGLGTR